MDCRTNNLVRQFCGMAGMPLVCGGSPQGHKDVVTDEPYSDYQGLYREVQAEKGIAKSQPEGLKLDNKAHMTNKLAADSEIQNATVTHMQIRQVDEERMTACPVRSYGRKCWLNYPACS